MKSVAPNIRKFIKLAKSPKYVKLIDELRLLVDEYNSFILNIRPKYNEFLKTLDWGDNKIDMNLPNLDFHSYLLSEEEIAKYYAFCDKVNASYGYNQKDFSVEGHLDMKIYDIINELLVMHDTVFVGIRKANRDVDNFTRFEELIYEQNKIVRLK